MQQPGRATYALLCALPLLAPAPAAAEPLLEVGGWFGPRIFSSDSKLGYIPGETYLGLSNAISFGPRIGRPIGQWIVPELEVGFAPALTQTMSVVDKAV